MMIKPTFASRFTSSLPPSSSSPRQCVVITSERDSQARKPALPLFIERVTRRHDGNPDRGRNQRLSPFDSPSSADPVRFASFHLDAGIEHAVEHVRRRVDHNVGDRNDEDASLHERIIPRADGINGERSDPRPVENLLGDKRAAE